MQTLIDVSLYPLADEFIPAIDHFIARLNARPELTVHTNPVSTRIRGDYDAVWDALKAEIRATFEREGKAVFVLKVLNAGGADAGA
ncbi:YkoF family thiamine/hydroxymethylpyrimidine-binding protein [Lentisalinibacter sediminis]|uniref:YkoF family thiamine/hydroxymethylpyrimidine-binding protein n=1 Tax=Lentisalinibacter sediminis TaxID=2992237 RepID=UPI0038676EED